MQLRVAENMANPQVLKLVLHIATIPLLPDLRPLQPVDEKFYHSTDQVMPCLAAKPPTLERTKRLCPLHSGFN
jgi:hypothetical protein